MGADNGMDAQDNAWAQLARRLEKTERAVREMRDERNEAVDRANDLAAQLQGPGDFGTWRDAAVDERVRRVAAEKREQALAAHVEEYRSLVDELLAGDWNAEPNRLHAAVIGAEKLLDTEPSTSLDHRDDRVIADALDNLLPIAKAGKNPYMIETIETNISHLRKRSGGADHV